MEVHSKVSNRILNTFPSILDDISPLSPSINPGASLKAWCGFAPAREHTVVSQVLNTSLTGKDALRTLVV